MILDNAMRVASAQPVTATAVSSSSIDLGTERDIGVGSKIRALWTVDTLVESGGASTVTVQLICASDAALTADIGVIGSTTAVNKAVLTVGRPGIVIEMNPDLADSLGKYERYLGARFNVGVADLTAGAFTIDFLLDFGDVGDGRIYPAAQANAT